MRNSLSREGEEEEEKKDMEDKGTEGGEIILSPLAHRSSTANRCAFWCFAIVKHPLDKPVTGSVFHVI